MDTKKTAATGDNLSAMHRKARKRRKRKLILTSIITMIVVAVALVIGITLLRNRVTNQFAASDTSDVESAQAATGSISTTVSGTGVLADEDVESVEIPSALAVGDFYVEEGDAVTEGDLIATVTNASLVTAMADVQASLDEIDTQLEDASGDEISSTITAGSSGRVKRIYAGSGDDVATVMYESGTLMLLSLDGYMAVDIDTGALAAGDSVTVTRSDGSTVDGLVEKAVDGTATVLVTDNGPEYEEEVTIADAAGGELGSGVLYIHCPMRITGYAGTVSSVQVSENDSVSAGATLLKLTDTAISVNYDTLLQERAVLEDQLAELIRIYKEGGICAPITGIVENLTEPEEAASAGSSNPVAMTQSTAANSYTAVATISPNESMSITISVDESDILSLSEGQSASVYIDSIGEDAYSGTVTSISTAASSDSGVTTYSATVTIDKTGDMLPGMSASVAVTIEGVDNALLIPLDALHQTSSTAYVYTEYDEASGAFGGMVEVTTGLSNSSYVEITSGLSEGDTVYYTADSAADSFGTFGGNMGSGFTGRGSGMNGEMGGEIGGSMGGGRSGGDMPMPGN